MPTSLGIHWHSLNETSDIVKRSRKKNGGIRNVPALHNMYRWVPVRTNGRIVCIAIFTLLKGIYSLDDHCYYATQASGGRGERNRYKMHRT